METVKRIHSLIFSKHFNVLENNFVYLVQIISNNQFNLHNYVSHGRMENYTSNQLIKLTTKCENKRKMRQLFFKAIRIGQWTKQLVTKGSILRSNFTILVCKYKSYAELYVQCFLIRLNWHREKKSFAIVVNIIWIGLDKTILVLLNPILQCTLILAPVCSRVESAIGRIGDYRVTRVRRRLKKMVLNISSVFKVVPFFLF